VYDPIVGRFLSPDNYVPMPFSTQGYNRYAYCLNNPLIYTDPSGEFVHLIIGAAIGGIINWATHGAEFTWEGLGYFGIGAVSGALGAGVGAGVNTALAGGSFSAGFIGSSTVTHISTGFASGFVTGAAGGGTSGFLTGFGNAAMEPGSKLGDMFMAGFDYGLKGSFTGGVMGGIAGGIDAVKHNRNFWTGSRKQYGAITIKTHGKWSFEPYENVIGKENNYVTELDNVSSINPDGTRTIILPKTAGRIAIPGLDPNVISFTGRIYTYFPSTDYSTQMFFGFRWHHFPITKLRHLFHHRFGSII
jgi:hypothetical protein